MSGLLFVTAPEADYKAINLLIHHLGDWSYSKGDKYFHLVTTRNAYDLEVPPGTNSMDRVTSPSLDNTLDNSWAGASLKDVEDFCLDLEKSGVGASLFVLVDSAGFQAHDAILAERDMADEGVDFVPLDKFIKMRVPWSELYSCWCNLDIANINFDELGERRENANESGEPGGEQGWHDYIPGSIDDLDEEQTKRKEKAFQRLQKDGRV